MATPSVFATSGRSIAYVSYGSDQPNAHVVFYQHGFPGSHAEASMFESAARDHNIRLVAADRPGMGTSTYQADRRLLDWPVDVLALADHLQVERFAVLGVSGGSPYALACLHKLPRSRCIGGGVVGGLMPRSLGTAGMLVESRVMMFLAPRLTGLVAMGLDVGLGNAARDKAHPERFEKLVNNSFKSRPDVDREVFESNEGGVRDALVESTKTAMRNGGQGAAWEARLYGSDWGFKLEDISVEPGQLVFWHGSKDINVPLTTVEKGTALITGAELRVSPEDAHASLPIRKAKDIMETVAQLFQHDQEPVAQD
ncbi:Alpha/Beta hydrolase protein [Xylariales sp. PMI_506]|nr:Alpha/Beta hydrolase protein [Xylariales sp. PMI_506]